MPVEPGRLVAPVELGGLLELVEFNRPGELGRFIESGGLLALAGLSEIGRLPEPIGFGGFFETYGLGRFERLEGPGRARGPLEPLAPHSTLARSSRIFAWRRIGAPTGAGRAAHLFGASHVLARRFACALFHRIAVNLVKSFNFYASPPLFARLGHGCGALLKVYGT
jgi:hypothetical protein